jgi:hypothetical protein
MPCSIGSPTERLDLGNMLTNKPTTQAAACKRHHPRRRPLPHPNPKPQTTHEPSNATQMLDNVTYDTMKIQLDLNLKMASDVGSGGAVLVLFGSVC